MMIPSTVVDVNRAVAASMAGGPQAGLEMLLHLESEADDLLRRTGQRRTRLPPETA